MSEETENLTLETANCRRNLVRYAHLARADDKLFWSAFAIIVVYNIVGLLDILSTGLALAVNENAQESNPFLSYLMESGDMTWIIIKLLLQALVSFMLIWFPHKTVLLMFVPVVIINALVVLNNIKHVVPAL